jgi:TP901 family phage tail tape measure protein
MAKKTIKGITVQIGGDTSGLTKALDKVDSALSATRRELREVEKGLKFDPGNTKLIAQQQEVLQKAIKESADKLHMLEDAQEKVDEAFKKGEISPEQYREYEREVEKTRKQLIDFEHQLKDTGDSADKSADGLKAAEKATKDVGNAADDASKEIGEFKNELKSDVQDAAKVVAALTAAILAVGKASVDAGMEFDSSMKKVMATLGYTEEQLNDSSSEASRTYKALRDYAQEMGASTKFSASQSAEALNYMAMAGWNDKQMLEGLDGVLNLAAASGSELATTSDIVTDALTAMGYGAESAGHLADVMAAASSNANTNVEMMGETFKYAAPVAGALGYSMEDVSVAIGLMANSGIKASAAGTALRGWLSKLAAPTKDSGQAMADLGISLTDSAGNMRSLRDVMGDTRKAFADLTEAEKAQYAKMLAGQQGMSGLLAIVNAAPADFEKLSKAIDNSAGAAENMANVSIDNLEGDITIMKSAIEGAEIAISDKLTPSLRKYAQIGTKTISAMSEAFGKGGLEGAVDAAHQTLRKEMGEDADTIFNVEIAVKALTAAFIAYKGALLLEKGIAALEKVNLLLAEGKTLTEATAAANLANPYVLAAAAVAALAVGLKSYIDLQTSLIDETSESYAEFTAEQQKVIDNVDELAQKMSESRADYEENTKAIEDNEKQVQALVDRLYDLDSVQGKDAAQKAEMSAIVDELNSSVEGLNLQYDEQTGKLNKTRDAVDALCESYFEEAKAEAYKNRLVKLIEEQAEAEEAHEKAVKAVEDAEGKRASAQNRVNSLTAAYNRTVEKTTRLEREMSGGSWSEEKQAEYDALCQEAERLSTNIQALNADIDNYDLGMGDLLSAQISAKEAMDGTAASIDFVREKMGEAGAEVPEQSAAVSAGIAGINAVMDSAASKADTMHNALSESLYISSDLEPALDEVYALVDEYNSTLESKKGALQNWFEGSVTVNKEDLSMNDMWEALNGTTTRLDEWQAKIDELTNEGVNDKYLQHLKDAGPESLAEIQNLFSVPEEERKRYADEWADGYERAAEVAEKQMQKAKEETNTKIGEIIGTIKENSPQMAETFNQLGIDGIDGYIAAFSDPNKLQELKEAVKAMVETAMAEVELTQDSNSPSKKFNQLGDYAGEGYALGFKDEETAVQKAARQMAEDAIKAVEAVNKAGLKAPQGFAGSIKESMASASAAKSGLQSTAKSLLTPTPPAKQEVIVKMPETIITKSYLDGRQIAENQASYLDSIFGNRAVGEARGHA